MGERVITVDGVNIWTENFGDSADPAVLLIMGASVQSIYWPHSLIEQLVAAGRFVIRFDNRDTGQSDSFDYATAPYTLNDMARDAIGVLDAYDLQSAHIAGLSMGGMVCQLLMAQSTSRIKTAALLMTSPLSGAGGQAGTADGEEVTLLSSEDLPGPDPAWVERAIAWQAMPATTREEKIQKRVESLAMMLGPDEVFDEPVKHALATREYDRARNYDANDNHSLAIAHSVPGDRRAMLAVVNIPTLVVHGSEDPILPYAHGVALAEALDGAELFTLQGVGHDLAERYLEEVATRLISLQNSVS